MGQHKTNPNSILKKEGKLSDKDKPKKMSKQELDAIAYAYLFNKMFKGVKK